MVRRRRYVLAEHIPRLERPSRRLRRRTRRALGYLAVAALVFGILAVVIIATQQEVIRLPSAPVQVGERSERVGVVSPDTTPPTTATRHPEAVAAQMTAPTAVPTRSSSPTNVTAAKVITSREADTQTPTFVPLATGTAALPPLASTSTTTPASTATIAVAPANTPTATPAPDKLLVLHTETAVEGYWSDGTANVGLELILRNEGSLALVGRQPIGVRCTIDDSGVQGCDANTEISLPDGFGPAAADLVLRVPMGLVKLDIDYGGEAPHFVSVNVPRRILGVDRAIWACYSDRSVANNSEGDHGCYGDSKRPDFQQLARFRRNSLLPPAFHSVSAPTATCSASTSSSKSGSNSSPCPSSMSSSPESGSVPSPSITEYQRLGSRLSHDTSCAPQRV